MQSVPISSHFLCIAVQLRHTIDIVFEKQLPTFHSLEDLAERLERARYVADRILLNVIYLADKLKKPILAEGLPGTGKTEAARVVAIAGDTHIERLQCYAGLDDRKAIGHFDESLQRLYLTCRHRNQTFSDEEWERSGRTGQLSITVLDECWALLDSPVLRRKWSNYSVPLESATPPFGASRRPWKALSGRQRTAATWRRHH